MASEWKHFGEYSSLKWAENGCKTAKRIWAGVIDTEIRPIKKSRLDGKTHYSVWARIDRDLSNKIVSERRRISAAKRKENKP